jgi:hypothetical protein
MGGKYEGSPMKIHPLAIGAVAAVGGAAIMLASGANAGTTSSSEQLIINQRISQAAVRRSNTALNYMGVIRTSTLDNTYGLNKSNPKGVTPLTQVTGAGLGWQTPQIRDGQVTTAKVAEGAVTQAKLSSKTYYAVWNAAGTAQKASTGVGTSKSSTGVYLVGPFPGDVSGCIYAPNVLNNSGASAGAILQGGNTFLAVQMTNATGTNTVDAPGSVMVYCPGS